MGRGLGYSNRLFKEEPLLGWIQEKAPDPKVTEASRSESSQQEEPAGRDSSTWIRPQGGALTLPFIVLAEKGLVQSPGDSNRGRARVDGCDKCEFWARTESQPRVGGPGWTLKGWVKQSLRLLDEGEAEVATGSPVRGMV